MVLSNIGLEDTIKNGFKKCGLDPANPENVDYTKCIQNHSEALANKQAPKLHERGIDSDIVVEKICELKQMRKDI